VANITEVVGVEVPDRPGGLYELLVLLEGSVVNIEYMYALTYRQSDQTVLVMRFDDPDQAIKLLLGAGINVLPASEIHQ
jgi:hypothetical protein